MDEAQEIIEAHTLALDQGANVVVVRGKLVTLNPYEGLVENPKPLPLNPKPQTLNPKP